MILGGRIELIGCEVYPQFKMEINEGDGWMVVNRNAFIFPTWCGIAQANSAH
jgi:hypothetical protein